MTLLGPAEVRVCGISGGETATARQKSCGPVNTDVPIGLFAEGSVSRSKNNKALLLIRAEQVEQAEHAESLARLGAEVEEIPPNSPNIRIARSLRSDTVLARG